RDATAQALQLGALDVVPPGPRHLTLGDDAAQQPTDGEPDDERQREPAEPLHQRVRHQPITVTLNSTRRLASLSSRPSTKIRSWLPSPSALSAASSSPRTIR